jgi:DNA invertase Pin-like site-specific DNA recombinase
MKAREFFEATSKIKLFGKKWLNIERNNSSKMERILLELLNEGLIPREIAEKLGISLSTLYRWLDKSKIRLMVQKGSEEWTKRILISKYKIKYGKAKKT